MMDKEQMKMTGKPCDGLLMEDPVEAYKHIRINVVRDYGDYAYGHPLYVWDDGRRILGKCIHCGGYVLIQKSEFHSFTDAPDGYYTDFFPVSSLAEADELNRKYDGFAIEREFQGRYLMETNGHVSWSK